MLKTADQSSQINRWVGLLPKDLLKITMMNRKVMERTKYVLNGKYVK